MTPRRVLNRLLLAAAVGLGVYGFYVEPSSLRVKEYEVALPGAGPALALPLRIAVIADLHANAP